MPLGNPMASSAPSRAAILRSNSVTVGIGGSRIDRAALPARIGLDHVGDVAKGEERGLHDRRHDGLEGMLGVMGYNAACQVLVIEVGVHCDGASMMLSGHDTATATASAAAALTSPRRRPSFAQIMLGGNRASREFGWTATPRRHGFQGAYDGGRPRIVPADAWLGSTTSVGLNGLGSPRRRGRRGISGLSYTVQPIWAAIVKLL